MPPKVRSFAHASEAELARLLDFYAIRWEYEPHTFAIALDEAGNITEAFAPDFYLPDVDLYIEVTVMKQSLATKKNRKLRLFRERFPSLNIKLFGKRDVERLFGKYEALRPSA
jgi:bifunctional protein TilS/HprT